MTAKTNDAPATAIADVNAERTVIRGYDLGRDLIGTVSFTEHVFFLITGSLPTPEQRAITDAVLVAIAEHGLVPSVVAARMTLAAAPEAWQGAVAAGILGCGSAVLGTSDVAGRLLADAVREGEASTTADAAARIVARYRAERVPLPGFGFPHPVDARADRLVSIARDLGIAGRHVAMLEAIADAVPAAYGRVLPINVSAAIPAVMLDAEFPIDALKGIPLLARTAGLIGHLLEESHRPIGRALGERARAGIGYAGPAADPGVTP